MCTVAAKADPLWRLFRNRGLTRADKGAQRDGGTTMKGNKGAGGKGEGKTGLLWFKQKARAVEIRAGAQ